VNGHIKTISPILSQSKTVDESSEQWKDGTMGGHEKGRLKGMRDARENRLPCLASKATSWAICHKVGGHDGGWRYLNSHGAAPQCLYYLPAKDEVILPVPGHTKNSKALCSVLQIVIFSHIPMKSYAISVSYCMMFWNT